MFICVPYSFTLHPDVLVFVRLKGLEPPRREAPDPKSGVATNYTTAAYRGTKVKNIRESATLRAPVSYH